MDDATYLEYRRIPESHTSSIHYLNMVRVSAPKVKEADTEIRRLTREGGAKAPYLSKVVTDVEVLSGQMTDVTNHFGFYSVA